MWGPKQDKVRKPWVLRLYCWISSMRVSEEERSVRIVDMQQFREVSRTTTIYSTETHTSDFILNTFWNGKPVQFFYERCWVVVTGCQENKSCSKVLNFLDYRAISGQTRQDANLAGSSQFWKQKGEGEAESNRCLSTHLSNTSSRVPDYRRRPTSLLWLCDVFPALIYSLLCWENGKVDRRIEFIIGWLSNLAYRNNHVWREVGGRPWGPGYGGHVQLMTFHHGGLHTRRPA